MATRAAVDAGAAFLEAGQGLQGRIGEVRGEEGGQGIGFARSVLPPGLRRP